jgi:phage terminase small subunit
MSALDNEQYEIFCQEYIKDFNGAQAAIRAGYSEKTARNQASRLLTNEDVRKRVEELTQERAEKTQIDAQYVLRRLHDIDQMDILDILSDDLGSFKPIPEWPKTWRTSISGVDMSEIFEVIEGQREMVGVLKKIKWPDKTKNLELLGKHVGIGAFSEKLKVDTDAITFNMQFGTGK